MRKSLGSSRPWRRHQPEVGLFLGNRALPCPLDVTKVEQKSTDTIKLLLNRGMDVDTTDGEGGCNYCGGFPSRARAAGFAK